MFHTSRRSVPLSLARLFRRRAAERPTDRWNPDDPPIRVEQVDDPDLPFRLIRAAGVLGPTSIERLLDAWANLIAPSSLHLDLRDARIDDADTMRRLESALDHLERKGITIRLVGIDPHHPVLHG